MSAPAPIGTRPQGWALTFAFGANLTEGFVRRCPSAVDLGTAILDAHRWISNRRGVASVVPQLGSRVYGTLWAISGTDLRALDRFEGLHRSLYRRELRGVLREVDGRTYPAWTYLATDEQPGAPWPPYIAGIIEAARRRGFPAEYLGELEEWRSEPVGSGGIC